MTQEPIKYDPDGEHKGMDLTGWYVLWRSGKRQFITHDYGLPFVRMKPNGSCFKVARCNITHLLGVDESKRLHPQDVADLRQEPVFMVCILGLALWCIGDENKTESVDSSLIQPYDPNKHQKEYEPRPIYRPEGNNENNRTNDGRR